MPGATSTAVEPQGLGAVVEDADAQLWVLVYRGDQPIWRAADFLGAWSTWADLTAPRAIAKGWSE